MKFITHDKEETKGINCNNYNTIRNEINKNERNKKNYN